MVVLLVVALMNQWTGIMITMIRWYQMFWGTLTIWWIWKPFARRFAYNGISKNWSLNNPSANRNFPHLHHYTCPLSYPFVSLPVPAAQLLIVGSVVWYLCQLVPCLIADHVHLEGSFLDFHHTIINSAAFRSNQNIELGTRYWRDFMKIKGLLLVAARNNPCVHILSPRLKLK